MKKLITNFGLAIALGAVAIIAPIANASTDADTPNSTEQCGDVRVEIKGFGAGLMYQPRPVALAGEHLSRVNIEEKCAVVSWLTDVPATSQVIFAKEGEIINMDATKHNLGFPEATTQNNSAYVVHSTIMRNLELGKTYTYRVVSRSHPGAVPTVSKAYTFVMPKKIVFPVAPTTVAPTVKEHTITKAPPTKYIQKPTVTYVNTEVKTKQESKMADILYTDPATTTPVIAEEPSGLDMLAGVPAAITATPSELASKNSFWQRLKRAFSFFGGSTATKEVTKIPQKVAPKEGATIDASGFIARAGFLIPTLFILLFIFLIQQIALPMLGIIVERPIVFWMFSVIITAIAGGLLKYYKITLIMIAVFLALLAWYLLTEANVEVNEKAEQKKPDETNRPAKLDPKTT